MRILLASTSPYRKKQLLDLGLQFVARRPDFDEDSVKRGNLRPAALAKKLALGKARSLQTQFPDHFIIGADQLLAVDNEVLGKPGTAAEAIKQLKKMSGRTHKLITSLAVVYQGKTYSRSIVASIKMAKLTDQEIRAYVRRDKPFDCAGSYRFEKGGFGLVESLRVSDPSSLIGLPLIELGNILRKYASKKGKA